MSVRQQKTRKTGFDCPLHPQQISTYVVVLFDFVTYYGVNMVSLAGIPWAMGCCSVVYFVIFVFVAYLAVKATRCDPTDPIIYKERELQEKNQLMGFDFSPYPLICAVCDTHVSSQAKHCGICNRCVDRFDHHCKWLNNCVGQQNYMTFFRLIICVFAMTLMHNITNLAVLITFYTETQHVVDTHNKLFTKTLFVEFQVLLYIASFFNFVTMAFLAHLSWFHVNLLREGKTTFVYIKEQQALQEGRDTVKRSGLFKSTGVDEEAHRISKNVNKAPIGIVCVSLCNLSPGILSKAPKEKPKLAGLKAISAEDQNQNNTTGGNVENDSIVKDDLGKKNNTNAEEGSPIEEIKIDDLEKDEKNTFLLGGIQKLQSTVKKEDPNVLENRPLEPQEDPNQLALPKIPQGVRQDSENILDCDLMSNEQDNEGSPAKMTDGIPSATKSHMQALILSKYQDSNQSEQKGAANTASRSLMQDQNGVVSDRTKNTSMQASFVKKAMRTMDRMVSEQAPDEDQELKNIAQEFGDIDESYSFSLRHNNQSKTSNVYGSKKGGSTADLHKRTNSRGSVQDSNARTKATPGQSINDFDPTRSVESGKPSPRGQNFGKFSNHQLRGSSQSSQYQKSKQAWGGAGPSAAVREGIDPVDDSMMMQEIDEVEEENDEAANRRGVMPDYGQFSIDKNQADRTNIDFKTTNQGQVLEESNGPHLVGENASKNPAALGAIQSATSFDDDEAADPISSVIRKGNLPG